MVIYGHIAIYSRIGLHMDYIFLLFDFFMLAVLEGNDIISEAHIAREGTISSHVSLHTGQPDGMLEGAVGGCLSSQAGLQGDVLAGTVRNHISSHTGPPWPLGAAHWKEPQGTKYAHILTRRPPAAQRSAQRQPEGTVLVPNGGTPVGHE